MIDKYNLVNIINNMILENLYYTDYYKNHWNKYSILFSDKYFENENKTILNDDYYIIHKKYSGYIHQKDIIGYERGLYTNHDNKLIYNYRSDDARMFKIINHNNNEYFIFNRDLSGFSIIDLNKTNKEFNFYYNKPINKNGIIVFMDAEYCNNKILFYIFYLSKAENGAFKRVFNYLLYDFSNGINSSQNYVNFIDIRKSILDLYNYELYFSYKAYFDNNSIIAEDLYNGKKFNINL